MTMIRKDLEKEYSPSKWNKRFRTGDEVLMYHDKFVTKVSEVNRQKYNCVLDIPYGEGKREKMDIYYKHKEKGSSIFVYIHGGFWQELDKERSAYCIAPIVEKGHRVIVLGYDLCPQVTLSEITDEMRKAINAIFKYAQCTSANSISFCGHSAGAHLIAYLLKDPVISTNPLMTSVFLISGVYNLTELWRTKAVNDDDILSLNAESARQLSPVFSNYRHLFQVNLKIYVFVAENDSPSFKQQTNEFISNLQKFDLKPKSKVIEKCDHFDIVENLCESDYEITQLILKELNESK